MGGGVRSQKNQASISVIIPVWNDAKRLIHCLVSLRRQNFPQHQTEVIVVDNGSTDGSQEVALSVPGVILLNEPKCGSYAARNRGLEQATGEYVAFIDSDCEAAASWLESAIEMAQQNPGFGIIAGRIDLRIEHTRTDSAPVLYERLFAFNQKANATYGLCVTANWFSPKEVLTRFGGFDERLRSGADTKLAAQIAAAGYRIIYGDSAVVYHPPRKSVAALCSKRRRLIGGRWAACPGGRLKLALWLNICKGFMGEARYVGRIKGLGAGDKLKTLGVILMLWAVSLSELLRLLRGATPRRS